MGTKMTYIAPVELANAIRRRYGAAAGKEKSRILEEFVAATGYHENSAIRVLNSQSAPKRRQTRHRPSLYDEDVSVCKDIGEISADLRRTRSCQNTSVADGVAYRKPSS